MITTLWEMLIIYFIFFGLCGATSMRNLKLMIIHFFGQFLCILTCVSTSIFDDMLTICIM